jgi:hypothetical protein
MSLYPIPTRDPISGDELIVTELYCESTGVSIRGRFEIPRYARLDEDQSKLLETFLRCRGVISHVERELGLSYPTVRSRIDQMLKALGFGAEFETEMPSKSEQLEDIIARLEMGEIDARTAKREMENLK